MSNIYTRMLFDDGKGIAVAIAWTDTPGEYEVGPTEAIAKRRLEEKGIDWRFIALNALMNRPFEGITPLERETVEQTIQRIRDLDERLERRE